MQPATTGARPRSRRRFASLHRFPVDVLKIDRIFVEQLERDERGTALTQGVIALAHAMELVALAEGIETAHQARTIRDLGCDLAQGYLFSWPLRPEDLTELLRDPQPFRTANRAHLGLVAGGVTPAAEVGG